MAERASPRLTAPHRPPSSKPLPCPPRLHLPLNLTLPLYPLLLPRIYPTHTQPLSQLWISIACRAPSLPRHATPPLSRHLVFWYIIDRPMLTPDAGIPTIPLCGRPFPSPRTRGQPRRRSSTCLPRSRSRHTTCVIVFICSLS